MIEIWKDIHGLEGLYQISNLGNVKSIKRGERLMKPYHSNCKYYVVSMYGGGHHLTVLIHRLVALHFIEAVDGNKEVNHINGNKLDNRAENLEWSNRVDNCNHAVAFGLTKSGGMNYRAKPIVNLQTGIFYDCIADAAGSVNKPREWLKSKLRKGRTNNTSFIYA